jgi:hypothetical protein
MFEGESDFNFSKLNNNASTTVGSMQVVPSSALGKFMELCSDLLDWNMHGRLARDTLWIFKVKRSKLKSRLYIQCLEISI